MILDDDAQEFYEERAGILEHMAGWPREKAEALARAEAEAYQMAKRNAEIQGGMMGLINARSNSAGSCASPATERSES